MVRSSLGVRLGRVSSGEPWVQGRLWEKKPKQCLSSLRTWISLFYPLSFCKQHTHTHTHTKDIFPPSFSFCLSFVNKRHTHAQKNSLVMFCFLSFRGILTCRLLWRLLSDCLLAFVLFCQFLFCESYMLLLHCRYKGYNANKYRSNTVPELRAVHT